MHITKSMTLNPLCLHPETSLRQVWDLAAGKTFRHFPVTDATGLLVGMVSDRDLRSVLPSTALNPVVRQEELSHLEQVRVDSIMSHPPISLPQAATLDDALLLFDRHRIGALPIVDHDGKLVGIITVRDVLGAYRKLFGIGSAGSSLVEIRDDGQPNLVSRIAAALESGGIVCTRILRPDTTEAVGQHPGVVYARVQTYNTHAVHATLRTAGLETVPHKTDPKTP